MCCRASTLTRTKMPEKSLPYTEACSTRSMAAKAATLAATPRLFHSSEGIFSRVRLTMCRKEKEKELSPALWGRMTILRMPNSSGLACKAATCSSSLWKMTKTVPTEDPAKRTAVIRNHCWKARLSHERKPGKGGVMLTRQTSAFWSGTMG